MNTNDLVRFVARCLAEITTICSLSLLAGGLHGWIAVIAAMVAACAVGAAVDHVLTDERVDAGLSRARSWLVALRAKAA